MKISCVHFVHGSVIAVNNVLLLVPSFYMRGSDCGGKQEILIISNYSMIYRMLGWLLCGAGVAISPCQYTAVS